jgi:lipid-binding SYLF domain-containing protein
VTAQSHETSDQKKLLINAAEVLSELIRTPKETIPEELFNKSECIVIVPRSEKAGSSMDITYGKGLMMCRAANRNWTAPSFIRFERRSDRFQTTPQNIDIIMLIMTRRVMNSLLVHRLTFGEHAEVAAGPLSISWTAQTNIRFDSEILSYSHNKGSIRGESLQGATMWHSKDDNSIFYGRFIDPRSILFDDNGALPADARSLATALATACDPEVCPKKGDCKRKCEKNPCICPK